MSATRSVALLALVAGCTGSPTGGGEPELLPAGTILAEAPNNPERGAYLVDVETGHLTQLASQDKPFSVAVTGGYSEPNKLAYGIRTDSGPNRVVAVSLISGDTLVLAAMPDNDHLIGAIRLSPDGNTLALQVWQWRIDRVELVLIDLATGTWTRLIDQATGVDAIPLASLRWAPDGRFLYAPTEVFPDRSELVRINLSTQQFETISPRTIIEVVPAADLSPDGQIIAHGDAEGNITFRDKNGIPSTNFPKIPGFSSRPTWSPDGNFLAFHEYGAAPEYELTIIIMRLSDGKRWPLRIGGNLTLWLSDWF